MLGWVSTWGWVRSSSRGLNGIRLNLLGWPLDKGNTKVGLSYYLG
jgi:hypothetical protein